MPADKFAITVNTHANSLNTRAYVPDGLHAALDDQPKSPNPNQTAFSAGATESGGRELLTERGWVAETTAA